MRRFVVSPADVAGDRVTIGGPEAHHIATVLRLQPTDRVTVIDGSGAEYLVELERVSSEQVTGRVMDRSHGLRPWFRLTLIQGIPKGGKMDDVVRMGTELGITEFVPAHTARSVAASGGRVQRWRRIATEAAKLSRRADVPVVRDPVPLAEALDLIRPALTVVLWEGEHGRTLADAVRDHPVPDHAALIVGPEGGLEEEEVAAAAAAGAAPVSLGPLILRTETAGVAAAAMLLYEFGLRRRPHST